MGTEAVQSKRDDIQGLRGIAVLAVVLFHVSRGLLPGGFAGVDIFFVISGYLITRILLEGMDGGGFSLREFYRRRVRRLFPALYAMLTFTLVAGLLILPPKLLGELAYTQFFTSLFVSNLAFAHLSGYFDAGAGLKPLLHTWSLGVEEQFYLVYPLVLLLIRRFAGRFLWPVLAGLAVLSLLAATGGRARPDAAFYQPAGRAFELLIGALCLWARGRFELSVSLRRWLSLAGPGLMVVSLFGLNDRLPFPGLWALPPCLGAAMLLVARDGFGNRLISAPPLVFTGDISYSLYLWHWPLLVYARILFGNSAWGTVPAVIAAFGLAVLSRRGIERPFLDKPVRFLWLAAAGAMALSIVSALAIYGARGLPQRFNAAEQAAFRASEDFSPERRRCHLATAARVEYRDTCVFGDPRASPSIAVWGDSEGVELARALADRLTGKAVAVRQITASACPPSVGFGLDYNRACREHNADMLLHLKSDRRVDTVVLVVNYRRYDRENYSAMMGGLELSALDLQASGKHVVVLYPLPVYDFDPPSQVGLAMRLGRDPRDVGMTRRQYEAANAATIAELDGFVQAHGLAALRPADVLCDAERCHVYDPAVGVLYFNGEHLGMAGAGVLTAGLTTPDRE